MQRQSSAAHTTILRLKALINDNQLRIEEYLVAIRRRITTCWRGSVRGPGTRKTTPGPGVRFTITAHLRQARTMLEDSIIEPTASKDLQRLVDVGLIVPNGEKRGRYYTGSQVLGQIRRAVRASRQFRDDSDPSAASDQLSSR